MSARGAADAALERMPGRPARRELMAESSSYRPAMSAPMPPPAPRPPLGVPGTRVSTQLVDRVRTRLATAPTRPTAAAILEALRAEGCLLDGNDLLRAADQVRSELTGTGVLEQFLSDPQVTDVLVNAPDSVWVERSGVLTRTAVRFPDEASVRRLAQRLAAQAGRRLDDAAPCVDAVLPGGTRLHAVLPPVAVRGTLISLRVPPRRAFSVEQLTDTGMLTPLGARLLVALAQTRVSFLISGGTGTGKTTLLGTLLGLVAPEERIVVAEECAEVVSTHPHIARLQCRSANQEGVGGVGLRTLVRQALRMRPDRVVVGEVRGVEVCDLLTAMNTGHEGGCATLHANGLSEIPARIESLAAPSGLSRGSIHAQLAAAVRVVVQLVRENGGRRRLVSIGVLRSNPDGWVEVLPAVTFDPDGSARSGPGAARLEHLLGIACSPPTPFPPPVNGIELPPPKPEPTPPDDQPDNDQSPAADPANATPDTNRHPAAYTTGFASPVGSSSHDPANSTPDTNQRPAAHTTGFDSPAGSSSHGPAVTAPAADRHLPVPTTGFGSPVGSSSHGPASAAPDTNQRPAAHSTGFGSPAGSSSHGPASAAPETGRHLPVPTTGFASSAASSPPFPEPFVADYGPRPAASFPQGGAA